MNAQIIREVVKVVLGDVLKVTYTVEPGVEGEVTINSSAPIDRDALIPTLEALLQTQGVVIQRRYGNVSHCFTGEFKRARFSTILREQLAGLWHSGCAIALYSCHGNAKNSWCH